MPLSGRAADVGTAVTLPRLPRLSLVVATGLVVSACSSGKNTAVPEREDSEVWLRQVDAESRRYLENRCANVAPLQIFDRNSRLFHECDERAEVALREEWNQLTAAATRRCVASSGSEACCFDRYVPGPEYQRRRVSCLDSCSAAVGHAVSATAVCGGQVDARPPADEKSPALTAAVEAILAECAIDGSAMTKCDSLPSRVEVIVCRVNCERLEPYRIARRRFNEAVSVCVQQYDQKGAFCTLDPDTEREGFSAQACRQACQMSVAEGHAQRP